jgi:hypothetical protein
VALYDVLVFGSLSAGVSVAYTSARQAGDGLIVIAVALLFGLVAGIATCYGFNRVGDWLFARTDNGPSYVPTLRTEFPFILLYVGAVVGIVTAVITTSALVRSAIHHVA